MANVSAPSRSAREGTALQGWILVSTAWLSVMANSLLGTVYATIHGAFASDPNVDTLISATASLPSITVAIFAWPFGLLGNRVGHKNVLFWALIVYGIVGTAPFWLPDLYSIAASRALVGIAEAAIMTCGTALIGDYFAETRRKNYLTLQTGTAPIASIIIILIGGYLGAISWRMPFLVYGLAFILAPLVALLIWQPARPTKPEAAAQPKTPFKWGRFIWSCTVTVFGMTAFLITIIQSSAILTPRGLANPSDIAFWFGLASLANPIGALVFAKLPWSSVGKLPLAFGLQALGFLVIANVDTWQMTLVGMTIANFGSGILLPALITWALGTLPADRRGSGTGFWMFASFLGQGISPFAIQYLTYAAGDIFNGLMVYAVACGASAVIALVCVMLAGKRVTA